MTAWHIANKSWGLLSIEFVTTAHLVGARLAER